MEERLPLQITVYDKNYVRQGQAMAPKSMSVGLVWNAPGDAVFTLDRDHRRVNDLVTRGARCVITYQPRGMGRQTIMSGIVAESGGSGGPLDGTREFTVIDDLDVFNDMLAYQVPGQPASNQAGQAYDKRTGPLDNVMKAYLRQLISGQSFPRLTVQADQGIGGGVTLNLRMSAMEYFLGACQRRGIGLRVVQTGTTRQVQTWTPATYPRVLTEESGVVKGVEFKHARPEVTRITVGIGGAGTAREFFGPPTAGFVDTAAEDQFGIQRHKWIDARDVEKTDPNKATIALERATELLTEGKAKTTLKAELVENPRLQFLKTYALGDVVTVKPAGATAITDRVREVEINWAEGMTDPEITPLIGDWSDSDDDANNKLVRRLLRAVEILGTE